jgi:protein tyrosine/serine phosphatase
MIPHAIRWSFGVLIALLIGAAPIVYYRAGYTNYKRLREVTPGVMVRSGQLTAEGFKEAVERYGIRTIVNLQNEALDPDVRYSFADRRTVKETDLCKQLGLRYIHISPDLIDASQVDVLRPEAIDQFLAVMDDPSNYPILLHCRAGLHRTGCLAAVYRMEYEGWSREEAIAEMKAHGFGKQCHTGNDYIIQYVLKYQPGQRRSAAQVDE